MGGITRFSRELEDYQNSLVVQRDTFRNVVTGALYGAMHKEGVTKTVLADRLGISKPAVTNLLSGERNLTIDKISEVCFSLDSTPQFKIICNRDILKERMKNVWVYTERSEYRIDFTISKDAKKLSVSSEHLRAWATISAKASNDITKRMLSDG